MHHPVAQFKIDGFGAPFRLDHNKHGGGVMIYPVDKYHFMINQVTLKVFFSN